MKDLQNWWQLTAIQIGCVVCLPVIVIGQTLSQTYGFASAVMSIIAGNVILLVLGLLTVKMSYENRKPTIQNAEDYFGARGITFFAWVMVASLVSWFGIQLDMMNLGVLDLFSIKENKEFWRLSLNLALGGTITACTLSGIRGIGLLANITLPFLLLTLGYAFWTSNPVKLDTSVPEISWSGASIVIALAIAFVVDLPTYYRFARTGKDGQVSIALIFILMLPLLEICGVYLTSGVSEGTILDALKREGSWAWNTWVALFLVLAGWTTNNINLYSGAICLQSVFKNLSEKKSIALIGIAGTVLSCLDLLAHLEITLEIIGIFIAGMGSVIITRYSIKEYFRMPVLQKDYPYNLLAWTLGIVAGGLGILGQSLTTIALLDAVIAASAATAVFTLKRKLDFNIFSCVPIKKLRKM